MPETRQFCTFILDGQCFGIEVENVQEVLRHQEMTSVPLAPDPVCGLINLRGRIVTALDLRRRLDLAPRRSSDVPANVVVRSGDEVVSLLVDQIGDVIEVGPETFERPPDTLVGAARDLIRGAHKLSGRLLLVLDIVKALEAEPPVN